MRKIYVIRGRTYFLVSYIIEKRNMASEQNWEKCSTILEWLRAVKYDNYMR